MAHTFDATLLKDETVNATGIPIPAEVVSALGKGKKPPVRVTVNGFSYRTTVAVMGGACLVPLSQERRAAAGVEPGDTITVTIELDEEPRTVDVPEDLAAALAARPGAREAFDRASYSVRKEFVRQVTEAKTPETRQRRIGAVVGKLG